MRDIRNNRNFLSVFLAIVTVLIIFLIVSINRNDFSRAGYKNGLPKVGAVIYKYDDAFMSYVRDSMEKSAFGKVALNIQDSQNDQSRQLSQIDKMINDKVRVLVVNLVDPKYGKLVVDKVRDAKLPVIFINKEPKASVLKDYSEAWYVGTNSAEAGILQGKIISSLWKKEPIYDKNKDGILSYVMLMGEPDHPDTQARTKYAIDEIKKSGIRVKELDSYYGMWDEVKARDKMDEWISKFGDNIEFVISNNDAMALGAITSLEKNGYITNNKIVPVVGVDAIKEALEKIKEGKMMGTVMNDAKNQGTSVINLAANVAEGKSILEGTSLNMGKNKSIRIPYIIITKENLDTAEQRYEQ